MKKVEKIIFLIFAISTLLGFIRLDMEIGILKHNIESISERNNEYKGIKEDQEIPKRWSDLEDIEINK